MPHAPTITPFRRALLGLTAHTDVAVVRLACALARLGKGELVAVHVVEVDWTHDLSEDIAGHNEAAAAILDRAEAIAEREGVTLRTELIQARDVGAALVDEAAERDADQLIVGLPYRQQFGGDFAIGRTIPYILQNAPCSVMILRQPMGAQDQKTPVEPAVAAIGRASF